MVVPEKEGARPVRHLPACASGIGGCARTCINSILIAASVYDEFSAGPYFRPICDTFSVGSSIRPICDQYLVSPSIRPI